MIDDIVEVIKIIKKGFVSQKKRHSKFPNRVREKVQLMWKEIGRCADAGKQ